MCQYDIFGIEEENSGWYTPKTTEYMYYHKDISLDENFPIQRDGHNCGVYSLWYLLLDIYKDKSIVDLEPNTFRNQLLLYMVCLYMYRKRVENKSYHFRNNWDWKLFFQKNIIHSR